VKVCTHVHVVRLPSKATNQLINNHSNKEKTGQRQFVEQGKKEGEERRRREDNNYKPKVQVIRYKSAASSNQRQPTTTVHLLLV